MSVPRTLYRQLLLTIRRLHKEGLPCTGCVGLPAATAVLCPTAYLQHAFRSHNMPLNDAFHAMRMLPRQLSVLQKAEEETQEALAQWQLLQQQWSFQGQLTALQQMEAIEAAAWLLQELVAQQAQQQLLLDEDVEELRHKTQNSLASARQQLDQFAAAVQTAAPAAFHQQDALTGTAGNSVRMQQLQALRQVLYQKHKLRCDPFEWVYDGLAPLLLPDVLQTRKGIPLSLSLITVAVARRLDLPLQLLCAEHTQMPGTALGPLIMQQLPPEVAARQAGRTLASAPNPDTWLVRLQHCEGTPWGHHEAVYLDVSQRGGKLLTAAECAQRYPHMESVLMPQKGASSATQDPHSSPAGPSPVISVWSNLARTMVLAHQRRGESDLVAHWLYQLLALDSSAEEWAHALHQ